MANFKYFWDLESCTSYSTHTVTQFDANCSSGGGVFKWVHSNNAGITNIPGIRIKPTGTTLGYWQRVFDGSINIGWFGTQNISSAPTFASLGISQATLNTRYGTSFASTSDNYDTTAIRYAMKLMETTDYQSVEFETKTYYLNKSVDLPRNPSNTSQQRIFSIEGNSCVIKSTTGAFNYFQRVPVNQADALNTLLDYGFIIKNITAYGSASAGPGQTFLDLGATLQSFIENIRLFNFDVGINLRFCLLSRVNNVMISNPRTYGLVIDRGNWGGAGLTNAQSNVTVVNGLRIRTNGTTTNAIRVIDASDVTINDTTIEGLGANYGVYVDTLNSSVVKDFFMSNLHMETTCSIAGVYIKANTGLYTITRCFNQYAQNLIYAESQGGGYPQINVELFPYFPGGTKFVNIGAGTNWDLINLKTGLATIAEYRDPLNNFWNTILGTIPIAARLRVIPTIIT